MSSVDYKIFNYQTVTPYYHVSLARDELRYFHDLSFVCVRRDEEAENLAVVLVSHPETDILIKKSLKGIIKRQ